MILLEAATSRFALAAAPFGIECQPERSLREAALEIREITRALRPLRLPDELRDFWTWWTPEQFVQPALDGFLSSREACEHRRQLRSVGYPATMMPIARYGSGMVWMELESRAHFGCRVFYGNHGRGELELWTIGMSGLLDLLTETFEAGGVTQWGAREHRLDPAALQERVWQHHREIFAPPGDWRVSLSRPAEWPQHWHAAATH